MGKIRVKANHPIQNTLGIKGFPCIIGCGEEFTVEEDILKAYGMNNFTIISREEPKKEIVKPKKKILKVLTSKDMKVK